jgi:hypothetical protein
MKKLKGSPVAANYKYRHAPPRAAAMIEALRGLGYSTATALADIIDNSIAAKAKHIDVTFSWHGDKSFIQIFDDGTGMGEKELDQAMRLGDKSPLDPRDSDDLGRFGLGLKTAAFSQCRSLTVASRKNGVSSCLRWDLDVLSISNDDGWHLLEGPDRNSENLILPINSAEKGTLVLLEKLDRIVTSGFAEQDFLDLIDNVERHLSMVFHRYLANSPRKINLSINKRPVFPWDPFLCSHPATWTSPVERFLGNIEVQAYVLPHKDRLSESEYNVAGGSDGWTAQQGFYVYRNERLLVAGSWLGLGQGRAWTKEEAHRLARIRLDIPNSADTDWKIDIRKSTARPPMFIRNRLTWIAEDTRSRARRVFAHKGQPQRIGENNAVVQAWKADYTKNGMRYKIDESHPYVQSVLEEAGSLLPQIKAMLRIIEETIPVQRIWLDTAEGKETPRTGFSGSVPDEVKSILDVMFRNMTQKKGMSSALAKGHLHNTEPFQNYPDLIDALPDESDNDGANR